ncbi:response regulator [Shinella sp.]|uniref:response regulator n=1 Tax=Shinella sp. TaxID=1870904 RepID=UPI0028AD3629|nr:response regulator [Shinella sp.]
MGLNRSFSSISFGGETTSGKPVTGVVAISVAAGDLDACRTLFETIPSGGGNAFILVHHQDAMHETMLVESFSNHTTMTAVQAEDGQTLAPEHLFVVPAGWSMTVQDGTIQLTKPPKPLGLHTPYDVLLRSLAAEYGTRATAVVLLGTDTDGSMGIRFILDAGGRVYLRDPAEADFKWTGKGMIDPEMAVHVTPLAAIAQALHEPNKPAGEDLGNNIMVQEEPGPVPRRQLSLGELCHSTILDTYAPATVLINRKHECLHWLGPVQRYLRGTLDHSAQDLLSIVPLSVHAKLRSALHRADEEKARTVAVGLHEGTSDTRTRYDIAVQPVTSDGEDFFLVSFLDADRPSPTYDATGTLHDELTDASVQRATASDIENMLESTDVATVFLDGDLNIRYFTPAILSIFKITMHDVGRPLADICARAPDPTLLGDTAGVLDDSVTREREIRIANGTWYMRRVMPYKTQEGGTAGVVIIFSDVSAQHRAHEALTRAKRAAERANAAKSRFLATASHDLRQPLQSLALLQGLLEKSAEGERSQKLVRSFRDTLASMSGMLNTLLDINKIEAGTVYPRIMTCRVDDVLRRLNDEFSYSAMEKGLSLRFVSSSLLVRTDPRLLEQMIRNLMANALKYTRHGKILLGCRRHDDAITIEVWDSGIGIAAHELQTIFDEYHQAIGDGADSESETDLGLGLGLSIVKRLSTVLGHRIQVRSVPGKGSVFSVHVALGRDDGQHEPLPIKRRGQLGPPMRGTVLVVEDDGKVRSLIEIGLRDEQHTVYAADDGATAVDLVSTGIVDPTLILADYNLPNGANGIDVVRDIRSALGRHVPAIILTGDITANTLRLLPAEDCLYMPKPVSLSDLLKAIQLLLHASRLEHDAGPRVLEVSSPDRPTIFVVEDDHATRTALHEFFEVEGRRVQTFPNGETFLAAFDNASIGCLVIDVRLPGMSGLDVVSTLRARRARLPIIVITGEGDVATAVMAMKAGASDFIEKPVGPAELLASISEALSYSSSTGTENKRQRDAKLRLARLTKRQREILDRVLAGQPSKVIAQDLDVSQRTVEAHRAAIMRRMQVSSLPALARLVMLAHDDQG